jgi:hypothetical protein
MKRAQQLQKPSSEFARIDSVKSSCNTIIQKKPGERTLRAISLELLLDELAPNVVGLPNRVQILACFRCGNVLEHDPIKVHERRHAHVGGAMNKNAVAVQSLHHSRKGPEILGRRRLKVHRDMNVSHAQGGNDAAFVWQRIVGGGKREIDDCVEARFMNLPKLRFCRLACGAKFVTEGTEFVDFG